MMYNIGLNIGPLTYSQVPSRTQDGPWLLKERNCGNLKTRSKLSAQKGVEGRVEVPGYDQEEDKLQLLSRTCIKPTNKVVRSFFGTPLVLEQATGDYGFTRLTTTQTQGKPPPSSIQYFLRYSVAPTPKWLFVSRLPRWSLKTVPIWTLGIL